MWAETCITVLLYASLSPLLSITMKGLFLLSLAAVGLSAPVYQGSKRSLHPPGEGLYSPVRKQPPGSSPPAPRARRPWPRKPSAYTRAVCQALPDSWRPVAVADPMRPKPPGSSLPVPRAKRPRRRSACTKEVSDARAGGLLLASEVGRC